MQHQGAARQESAHGGAQRKVKVKHQRAKPAKKNTEVLINEGMVRRGPENLALWVTKYEVYLMLTNPEEEGDLEKTTDVSVVNLEVRSGILEHVNVKIVVQQQIGVKVIPKSLEVRDHKDRSNEHGVTRPVVKGQERYFCLANVVEMMLISLIVLENLYTSHCTI